MLTFHLLVTKKLCVEWIMIYKRYDSKKTNLFAAKPLKINLQNVTFFFETVYMNNARARK